MPEGVYIKARIAARHRLERIFRLCCADDARKPISPDRLERLGRLACWQAENRVSALASNRSAASFLRRYGDSLLLHPEIIIAP